MTNYVDPDAYPDYFKWLEKWAWERSDGCTVVSEMYYHCCWAHDFGYKYGFDPYQWFHNNHVVQSRLDTDRKFRECMQAESPAGRFSPVRWVRWAGVRLFGRFFYKPREPVELEK